MDLGIRDRRAIVGGATSGLGRATAEALAAEGCRLLLWARDIDRLAAVRDEIAGRHGSEVHVLAANAADPETPERIAEAGRHDLGGVDILVINAGGPPPVDPTGTDPGGWAAALQMLTLGPIDLATRLLPGMRERHWGRIVAILSSGVRQPITDLVYSNAGRGALAAWLKTSARVVAADGVTLNGVLPWGLDTPRVRSLDEGRARMAGASYEETRAAAEAAIPAGRYGRPSELASLVAYLCSESAAFQTGTFTAVDGGFTTGMW